MRLGEIKKIIEKTLDKDGKMTIQHEPIYGGQAHSVNNFADIMFAIDVVYDKEWNELDHTPIKEIRDKYNYKREAQIEIAEFNQLNSYIASLNTKLLLYLSILETMTEDQEEKIINIKLPDDAVGSLEDLAKLNNRLGKIFKEFNIDGVAQFKGFDKGTDWYMVYFAGILSYQSFIACLKIAQEYYKTKKEYYGSKKAELDYRASVEKDDDFSKDELKDYTEKRLELFIKEKVNEAINTIDGRNGKTKPEMNTQLVIATKDLVKEFGTGVEFHLSLNPPAYAEETAEGLKIDYKKIKELKAKESAPKKIKGVEDVDNKEQEKEIPKQ